MNYLIFLPVFLFFWITLMVLIPNKLGNTIKKKFHRRNGARLIKRMRKAAHTSIEELPVYEWWQVHQKNDYSHILKKRKPVKKWQALALKVIWGELVDQYIQAFGLNETYQEVIEIQKNIIMMRCEAIARGEQPDKTLIEVEEFHIIKKLKDMGERQQTSYYEHKGYMEHLLGFSIDVHKCSVKEYYSYKPIIEGIIERKQQEVSI